MDGYGYMIHTYIYIDNYIHDMRLNHTTDKGKSVTMWWVTSPTKIILRGWNRICLFVCLCVCKKYTYKYTCIRLYNYI